MVTFDRRRARKVLAAASLTAAAWIAMSELDRLIGSISVGGSSYSASELYGPTWLFLHPFTSPDGEIVPWQAAAFADTGEGSASITDLLVLHAFADGLFVIGYVLFALLLVRYEKDDAFRRAIIRSMLLLGIVDMTENVVSTLVFRGLRNTTLHSLVPLHVLTVTKWLLVTIVIVLLLWRVEKLWPFVRHLFVGLWFQRFSVAVVGLLALLMASTEGEIQEQLPDVQRSWLDGGADAWRGVLALAALLLLTLQMLFLGRQRTEKFAQLVVRTEKFDECVQQGKCSPLDDPRDDTAPSQMWRSWGVFVLGALLVLVAERLTALAISYERLLVFILIPVGVLALSLLTRALVRWTWFQDHFLGERRAKEVRSRAWRFRRADIAWVKATGDAIAGVVIAVAGVGLVRAFVAPAVLVPEKSFGSWILVGAGLLLAVLVWFAIWVWLPWLLKKVVAWWPGQKKRYIAGAITEVTKGSLRHGVVVGVAMAVIIVQAAATIWLMLWPLTASQWLGVTAAITIVLGAITALLTWVTLVALKRRPLEFFRLLRFRVTPIITMVALIAFVAATVDMPDEHHTVRTLPGVSFIDDRPDLRTALGTWAEKREATGCLFDITGSGSLRATPMVVVAAAGGGIRAAWWAARGISSITAGDCGAHAVFLSSGVSGGSVGLALADVTPDLDGALGRLAGQDALAAAASSLLTGDLLHALTGITIRPIGLPSGEDKSEDDRAALMELSWEQDAPELKQSFGSGNSGSHRAGHLILNSTSVTSGCRVLVSTIRVAGDGRDSSDRMGNAVAPECGSKADGAIAGTYDLLDAYFAKDCMDALSTTTASLLSARFPYLTPTGVTGQCDALRRADPTQPQVLLARDQLVDGGYSEGSGLGTLDDIAPELMTAVREHNAAVMSGRTGGILVVPFTVFLENHFNLDLQVEPPGHETETIAPISTKGAAARRLYGSNALLQRLATQTEDWLSCADMEMRCRDTVRRIDSEWNSRIVVVAPESKPRVEAPLGWVLSGLSRTSMDEDLQQTSKACRPEPDEFRCPPGVWRLEDLTQALKGNMADN